MYSSEIPFLLARRILKHTLKTVTYAWYGYRSVHSEKMIDTEPPLLLKLAAGCLLARLKGICRQVMAVERNVGRL